MNPNHSHSPVRIGLLSYAHSAHAVSYSSALAKIDGAELTAIFDDDPQRGKHYAEEYQAAYYSRVEELLGRDDIQGVIVCSPTCQHKDLVCAAAQYGKSILCEKPIAANMTDGQAMVDACKQAGVLLQVAFVCRFYPTLQAARKIVQSGDVGKVLGVVGGNRGRPPLPPLYPEWITDPAWAGGGALLDHSVHVTDAMRFILEAEVETVFAEKGTFRQQGLKVEDCALLSLTFQGGVIATVDPSWSLPENNPYHYDFYLRILCEKGMINLDDTRQALTVVSDHPTVRGVTAEPFGMDVDVELVCHFVNCLRVEKNLFPAASGEDGLRALEIALAGYESTRVHQPISIPFSGRSS